MVSGRRKRLAFARGLALLAALWLGCTLSPTAARADAPPHYLAVRKFEIPYAVSNEQSFNQLLLYVSSDGRTYNHIDSTKNRKGEFSFTASADGVYSFVVQLEDAGGTRTPNNVQTAIPTTRVVVDTEKPVVTLRAVQPKDRRAAVEWKIEDRYLDLRTLRLEAKGAGETAWTPLKTEQMQHAQFSWDPPGAGPFEVRLSVKDLAGNEGTGTATVTPLGGAAAAPAGAGDDRPVIHVKQKRFNLTYNVEGVGPSKIKHVEVWWTRDRNQWTFFAKAPDKGPFAITVPSAGRYGFTLRPITGVGRGPAAPSAGALPQLWVEVDETKPDVQIHKVTVGEGADKDRIIINYICLDKFLRDKPITALYKKPDETEWKVLQENVENTGTLKCTPPEGVFEFFVRLEAIDKAGNKGSAQSRETIKVDLAIPEVKDIGASIAEPAASPPGNPAPN